MRPTTEEATSKTWVERRYLRLRSAKRGEILSSALDKSVPVTLRDMSAAGAQLAWSGKHQLPTEFRLSLKTTAGNEDCVLNCRLHWQDDGRAGVTFY